jgi:hypothetical protein
MYMEQVGDMESIDFEETLDRDLGKIRTSKRDVFIAAKVTKFSYITKFFVNYFIRNI